MTQLAHHTENAELATCIESVRRRVADAAVRAGRRPDDVTIIAVTKTVPLDRIRAAFALGLTDFGENRVQEAEAKIQAWPTDGGSSRPRWHLIGHLQTNKVKRAVQLFDTIHSVDSVRLATMIGAQAEKLGKVMPVLLEVNVSGEATKFGFTPDDMHAALPEIARLPGLRVVGLMTIAPHVEDPEDARPVFRRLRELRDEAQAKHPELPLTELSMGMTNDFEVAIEEGATFVRVGRAIFGERPVPAEG